ncbi:hypothetical protein [Flavobacterium sp.]|uniref:hypothetical protein n=1 Tax=Flavobacterium sp. TaxID=239 RepID=UPI00122978BB|nr:hypothetical protein [Flavobacterium sp.]RZJ70462.1 MAG: hypothetical protein EOO49_13455 [Flavobacterium sp.]
MFKEEKKKSYRIIAICALVFLLGFFLRDWISIKEDPFPGNTFYIITGNLFMACSVIVFAFMVRKIYRIRIKEKRKKSGSKVVFLDENEGRRKSS